MSHGHRVGSTSYVWGYVLVLAAASFFIISMYLMIFSKLFWWWDSSATMPAIQSPLIQAIERDIYYCYLLPLTIPITIIACYANWVGLKFFRHN